MYLLLQNRLVAHVRAFLKQKYNIDLTNIVVEQPPKIEFGEFALPVSFELARSLRKAPRKIADEIVAEITLPEGFAKFEVAGAGYINARLDRSTAAQLVAENLHLPTTADVGHLAKWAQTAFARRRRRMDGC